MISARLPDFARSSWYRDPTDHRCPHDAWLESFSLVEHASGARNENRRPSIVLQLLGAYHDGTICFRYEDVVSYSLSGENTICGAGDWIFDEFEVDEDGFITHRIHWSAVPRGGESTWRIKARTISYEWTEKQSGEPGATDNPDDAQRLREDH